MNDERGLTPLERDLESQHSDAKPGVPWVSVVTVSYNRSADLLACLASLEALSYPCLEVIVIDNGSSDGTTDAVLDRYPNVRLFGAKRNLGTSVSRNIGTRLARGEFIWFLDSDAVVTRSDYLEWAVTQFGDDPRLGVLGGEAVLDGNGKIVGVKRLNLRPNGLSQGELCLEAGSGELLDATAMPTCNFLTRKSILRRVGGFDPWFFFYLEDLDLSYRIQRAGYTLKVVGKTPVVHNFSPAVRPKDIWTPRKNRVFFALKNFPAWKVATLPALDLLFFARVNNVSRLWNFAKKVDLGTKSFFQVGETNAAPTTGGLARSIRQAAEIVLSTYAGYFLVARDLPEARARRKQHHDFVGASDLTLVEPVPKKRP